MSAARLNRRARREKVGFRLNGDAVAETEGGMAYAAEGSTGTGTKHVVVFIVPGVEPGEAAVELRALADELER